MRNSAPYADTPSGLTRAVEAASAGCIAWLLGRCLRNGADPARVIEQDAAALLAARLRTALQVEQYLTLAFKERIGSAKGMVTAAVVEAVLSRQLDDLEPRLTRHGYDVRSIADEFRLRPADVRLFLQGGPMSASQPAEMKASRYI